MSIIGIGTDIVSVKRIEVVLSKKAEQFSQRLLTEDELIELAKAKSKSHFVSKRWAAKEAIAKAFSTGIGQSLSFQDIQINHKISGAPVVVLSERAQKLAKEKGIADLHISISDENEYAVAFAVASS